MKTKLNELLEFPTPFTYKVMGLAKPELVDQVVEVVQRHAPGDYSPPTTRFLLPSLRHTLSRLRRCTKSSAISKSFVWCCSPFAVTRFAG